jgi:hypothetical protein
VATYVDQVDIDPVLKQPGWVHFARTDWQQQALLAGGIAGECGPPLRAAESRIGHKSPDRFPADLTGLPA